MVFTKIDLKTWDRTEHFHHYMKANPCTYSMTVKLDITRLRQTNTKLYPAMLYGITKIVNAHEEFRMALDEKGEPGYYDEMHPIYTVFHKDTKTFSNIWTQWQPEYGKFLSAYEKDLEVYGNDTAMLAKPDVPPNVFPVSMIPWATFESFHLNVKDPFTYLSPIFTMGKFYVENGKTLLPLSIQIHHGACDGFHVSRFVEELQDTLPQMRRYPIMEERSYSSMTQEEAMEILRREWPEYNKTTDQLLEDGKNPMDWLKTLESFG